MNDKKSAEHHIRYRPHIDGLRGVAIIAVVLYHANLLGVTGGFVGVDVFFVISGFLITSIIVRDLNRGTFSLMGFWERRIRRILPALIVVMCFCIIAAYFLILYPDDYHHFGNTLIAQSVFASNILFMLTNNYFDQSSNYSPVLHTWSLSVEEQFYIVFPFIVLFCAWLAQKQFLRSASQLLWQRVTAISGLERRIFQRPHVSAPVETDDTGAVTDRLWGQGLLLAVVIVFGIVSFLINIWFVDIAAGSRFTLPFLPNANETFSYATAGFYLLPTRAWELGLGIAVALSGISIRSKHRAEATALFGIAAIVGSAFLFNGGSAFPGVDAFLPALGTAAVIAANETCHTGTGALLSSRVLVWVGLISYSLYLWHFPLFVFAKVASLTPLTSLEMAALIALAVLIAWLSYKFIETPFRKKVILPTRKQAFLFGLASLAVLAFIGFIFQRTTPELMERIPLAAKELLPISTENWSWGAHCFQFPGDGLIYGGLCRIGNPSKSAKPQFVVWGDSHADALTPLFDAMGRTFGVQGVVFDDGGCAPIVGAHQLPVVEDCENENQLALQYIRDNNIKRIVLVARWSFFIMGGPDEESSDFITDSNRASASPAQAEQVFETTLIPMVDQLVDEGREVYIVKQAPEQFDFDTRKAFYRAVHTGQEIPPGIATTVSEAYQARANSVIDSLATNPDIQLIDPSTILCKEGGICELETGSNLLYRDEDHLSTAGAMMLEPLFANFFGSMRPE
jgi:peptidoglycan/LPS O-acetylase OafA/YrhL